MIVRNALSDAIKPMNVLVAVDMSGGVDSFEAFQALNALEQHLATIGVLGVKVILFTDEVLIERHFAIGCSVTLGGQTEGLIAMTDGVGGGTDFSCVEGFAFASGYDRVVVISDMQGNVYDAPRDTVWFRLGDLTLPVGELTAGDVVVEWNSDE